jgi:hypothetical protein
MIVVGAIWNLVVQKVIAGSPLEHLVSSSLLLVGAGSLNAWLGWYRLHVGSAAIL